MLSVKNTTVSVVEVDLDPGYGTFKGGTHKNLEKLTGILPLIIIVKFIEAGEGVHQSRGLRAP